MMSLAGPVHFLTHTHTTHLAPFLGSPNGWVKGGRGGSKPHTKKNSKSKQTFMVTLSTAHEYGVCHVISGTGVLPYTHPMSYICWNTHTAGDVM